MSSLITSNTYKENNKKQQPTEAVPTKNCQKFKHKMKGKQQQKTKIIRIHTYS